MRRPAFRLLTSGVAGVVAFASSGCAEEVIPESPPRQLSASTFHYPEELWDAGVEGEAVLRIRVTEVGTVDSATIDRSSGHAAFDSAALDGAHALRFAPALRADVPVPSWAQLPVRFRLDTSAPLLPSESPPSPDAPTRAPVR